jgi:hypothetical protein
MGPEQELELFRTLGGIEKLLENQGKTLEGMAAKMEGVCDRVAVIERAHNNGGCQSSKELRGRVDVLETAQAADDKEIDSLKKDNTFWTRVESIITNPKTLVSVIITVATVLSIFGKISMDKLTEVGERAEKAMAAVEKIQSVGGSHE